MKLADNQLDERSLARLGDDAVQLLCSGDLPTLTDRYGYALRYDRELEPALKADISSCLSELQASSLVRPQKSHVATVKYFSPNDPLFFAVIECLVPTDNGRDMLVELIVTSSESGKHVTLEQISAAT